jgi:hypothetical protein
MLDINDFMQTVDGKGVINILTADKLMNSPACTPPSCCGCCPSYRSCPRLATPKSPSWFFDEAHLLFNEAPKVSSASSWWCAWCAPKASAFTRRKPAGHS